MPQRGFLEDEPQAGVRPFELPAAPVSGGGFPDDAEDPLRETLDVATRGSADQASRVFNLRLKTGLPSAVIERNLDAIERQAVQQGFDPDRFRRESPYLAQWLQEHPDNAKLAHDDLASLSGLERALQVGQRSARALTVGPMHVSSGFWGLVRMGAELGGADDLAEFAAGSAAVADHIRTRLRGERAGVGRFEGAVYSGLESLSTSATALPLGALGGAGAVVGVLGAVTGGDAYTQARAAGRGVGLSSAFALGQGAVEAATEFIPAHWFLQDLAANATFWKTIAHQAAAEIPGEQVATVLQDLNEWATLQPDATFMDYLRARPSAAADTLVATIVAVAGQGAIVTGLERVTGKPASEQVVEQLHEATAASKTRDRAPAALAAFVEAATKAGGLTHVYAPASTFTEYFQQKGVDPEALAAELTGNPDALRLAQATNGDLAIPTATYLSQIVGSGHEAFFAQELRLSPDSMNARETREAMKTEAERVAGEPAPIDATAQQRQEIGDRMVARLTATGRFTPQEAETQAALYAAVFGAATAGRATPVDPLALHQRFTGAVTAEGRPADTAAATTRSNAFTRPSDGGPVDIPASEAKPGETAIQRTTRRQGHMQALLRRLVPAAQAIDPHVDLAALERELDLRLGLFEDKVSDEAEGGRGVHLLRAIAKYGGLWWEKNGAYRGEIKTLLEGRDIAGIKPGTGRVVHKKGRKTWGGVPGVFHEEGKTPDAMVEALMEDPEFQYIEGDINHLLAAVDDALRHKGAGQVDRFPGTAEIRELGIDPATRWWDDGELAAADVDESEPAEGGDDSFDVAEFRQEDRRGNRVADDAGRELLGPGGFVGPAEQEIYNADGVAGTKPRAGLHPPSDLLRVAPMLGAILSAADPDLRVVDDSDIEQQQPDSQDVDALAGALDARLASVPTSTRSRATEFEQGGDVVATLTGEEFAAGETDLTALRRAAIAYYTRELQHGIRSVERPGFGVVVFSTTGKKKFKSTSANADKLRLVPAIPNIIAHGDYEGRAEVARRPDGIVAFHYFGGDVRLGERVVRVGVTVAEDDQGNKFYNLNPDPEALRKRPAQAVPQIQERGPGPSAAQAEPAVRTPEPEPGATGPEPPGAQVRGIEPAEEGGDTTLKQSIPPAAGGVNVQILAQDEAAGTSTKGTFNPDTRAIRLLKHADRSTFLHESAHLFLEMKSELALDADASPQERGDMATLLRWVGFDGDLAAWRALTHDQRREHHEQFARAFETYLGEGRAPTPELQPLFARFRAWLLGVYRTLRRLNVELSDDVRKVMDRMVATQDAIAAAEADAGVRALFTDTAAAGVSPAEFEGYRAQLESASEEARARLQQRLMRELAREQERWWQEEREAVRADVAAEIYARPVYRAIAAMRGTRPDGSPLPEGTPATPMAREALVGQFGKSILKKLPRPYLYSAESGLPPDTVAEIFGFRHGEDLVSAILAAPAMDDVIDAITDERMLERHGDLLNDRELLANQAREAIAGEHRDTVIRAELGMLSKLRGAAAPSVRAVTTDQRAEQRAAERAGAERLRSEMPDQVTLTRLAQQQVASMRLRDIRPDRFFAAARRHSRNATLFAAQGKLEDAVEAKQQELVNLALYREAVAAREAVDAAREAFGKMFKPDAPMAKRRNMDYIQAARAIAAELFWPEKRRTDAHAALELIAKHDPELYEVLAEQINAALAAGHEVESLTFEAFQVVRESVDALWEQSLRTQQMLIDGQLVARDDVIAALQFRLDEIDAPLRQEPRTKRQMYLLGARAALRRVEHWVDYVDGGEISGPFRRYLWQPIAEATARYRIAKGAYLQKYLDLVKTIEKTLVPGRIVAPELGFTFESRAQLLHALLHAGNESNFQKLVRGYGWGEMRDDGTVDPSKWQRFLARAHREGVITKSDWDFVQAVWDLVAELKPQSQAAHREMYGTYFSEITAWPVETPFGTYAGGYVPALVDPLQSADASVRNEKEALSDGGNAFMFPTTGRGFTKARVEAYAKPLALDLRLVPAHLDKVLRFIHIEPRVKDAGRLLWTHRLRERLNAYDPTAAGDMLVPWLQRAASQRVAKANTGWAGRAADQFFRTLRARSGLSLMVGNVVNTLQQFTGVFPAALKVKPRYLRNALWRYVRAPGATVAAVHEASDFMRTRLTAQAIEINQTIEDLLLNPSTYERVREFGARHGYFMQAGTQNIVDVITWAGAYEQAMEQHGDVTLAVREADAAVRQTQGSFAPEDVSKIEATTPLTRLFVMFYGYFNMIANLNGTEFAKITRDMGLRRGAGRGLYVYAMGFMLPAVLSEILLQSIGGFDDDDDDWHVDETMRLFFGAQARTVAAMVPGGQVALAAFNAWNEKPYDDRISTSPAVQLLESAVKAPAEVYEAIVHDGPKKRAVRDTLAALALMTGLPVGALMRPAGYLADVVDERAAPEGAADLARGLVSGRTPQP